jgi:hypothetical protein
MSLSGCAGGHQGIRTPLRITRYRLYPVGSLLQSSIPSCWVFSSFKQITMRKRDAESRKVLSQFSR